MRTKKSLTVDGVVFDNPPLKAIIPIAPDVPARIPKIHFTSWNGTLPISRNANGDTMTSDTAPKTHAETLPGRRLLCMRSGQMPKNIPAISARYCSSVMLLPPLKIITQIYRWSNKNTLNQGCFIKLS